MARTFTQTELEAYLDEALAPEEMAAIERELRGQPQLLRQLSLINARRDAGVHTLGEIWRRHRISCPTREQLGSHLLGTLSTEIGDYVAFHVEVIGCRFCLANLGDMRRQQAERSDAVVTRRSRYFQSSAGYLRGEG
jgi:hypothetical protein